VLLARDVVTAVLVQLERQNGHPGLEEAIPYVTQRISATARSMHHARFRGIRPRFRARRGAVAARSARTGPAHRGRLRPQVVDFYAFSGPPLPDWQTLSARPGGSGNKWGCFPKRFLFGDPQPCCTDQGVGAVAPAPALLQAIRTEIGRPSSSIRLRAWTATSTSVARRRSVRERSPSPMTCLNLPMAASARARFV